MEDEIPLMLEKDIKDIDLSKNKTLAFWIENKGSFKHSRNFLVTPEGKLYYKDGEGTHPVKRQKYYVKFIYHDLSEQIYRVWQEVFIKLHLVMYKFLEEKKKNGENKR